MITAEEKKNMSIESCVSDRPKYPYGLKLHFNSESFKKLDMSEAPQVGEKYMILAYAEVCDVQQEKYEGDEKSISFGLQIMDIDLKKKNNDDKNHADKLYGGGGE